MNLLSEEVVTDSLFEFLLIAQAQLASFDYRNILSIMPQCSNSEVAKWSLVPISKIGIALALCSSGIWPHAF